MSKASDAANAVVYSAIQVCELYRVKTLRMQSRVIWVPGAAARPRPMFFGKWTDENGVEHNSGMADLLARPRLPIRNYLAGEPNLLDKHIQITELLWIECKAGKGKMSPDQHAFKHYVESNGEHYVLVQNDLRPLMQWFDQHGLKTK